jgi:hypothetical protein
MLRAPGVCDTSIRATPRECSYSGWPTRRCHSEVRRIGARAPGRDSARATWRGRHALRCTPRQVAMTSSHNTRAIATRAFASPFVTASRRAQRPRASGRSSARLGFGCSRCARKSATRHASPAVRRSPVTLGWCRASRAVASASITVASRGRVHAGSGGPWLKRPGMRRDAQVGFSSAIRMVGHRVGRSTIARICSSGRRPRHGADVLTMPDALGEGHERRHDHDRDA